MSISDEKMLAHAVKVTGEVEALKAKLFSEAPSGMSTGDYYSSIVAAFVIAAARVFDGPVEEFLTVARESYDIGERQTAKDQGDTDESKR